MRRVQLEKESKHWVHDGIITEQQREQILNRNSSAQHPLLFTFAAIFIGLGFLTFIASNWSAIPDMGKLSIIIGFLLLFSIGGEVIYRTYSKPMGRSLLLLGILVFGAGLFLIGQMYHYHSFSAIPFFIWSAAAFLVFLIFSEQSFFIATLVIMTVGQVYSGIVYQDYHFGMGGLFLIGLGWFVYKRQDPVSSLLFAASYVIQCLILIFSLQFSYYWLILLFFALYIVSHLVRGQSHLKSFGGLAVWAIFILNVFQVFLLGQESEQVEYSEIFFLIWTVFFVYAVLQSALESTKFYWIDLVLFIPVFRIGAGGFLSLCILFIYSLGWLLAGYKRERSEWVNKGTFAFLFTTFVAYFQLAWDFMDRSLFFFIGGVLLFLLSYFLERKRRAIGKERVVS
ncbi:DUF2157 domain-containing protein [Halobacillus naozhouensis]|uniref:DUF2157 domain-containing protein n=1 Tax=Halobacillus naozhouensis TaxID=554880 RepID=A0ABY8J5G8_9BACI|nr:DUF2157 domain-containing protein [Halobacillus naozhouensis]WFT76131.1 DUF2157 domain-containing protein [Halobacillus naozhouensis]